MKDYAFLLSAGATGPMNPYAPGDGKDYGKHQVNPLLVCLIVHNLVD